MASIGPELPPHLLAKKKRRLEEEANSASITGATPEKTTSKSPSPESASKRRRVLGPAPPPAPLEQRPVEPLDEVDESSSDDEYGPALASRAANSADTARESESWEAVRRDTKPEETTTKSTRDEWMLMPPTQDDLAARMDPTKVRARKFNSGKGAKGTGQTGVDNSMWTETPEQKRKRLRDQVLGIQEEAKTTVETVAAARKRQEDEEKARKVREYDAKYRGKSLVEQHQQGSSVKEKEDDPTKRAFDYEKDMGSGAKIGHAQKREMMKRAADLGSKFSSGSYL